MGAISYGEVILEGKLIKLSAYRGEVTRTDGANMVCDGLECRDPVTYEQVCPGIYCPDAMVNIPGFIYDAGATRHVDDPYYPLGVDLKAVDDGEYYGLLMARTFIMVVRPASSGEPDTFERIGSIYFEDNTPSSSDKTRYFANTDLRVLKLV